MTINSGPNLGLMVDGLVGEQHYTELMKFMRGLDGLVQCRVLDKDLAAPPGSPANGAMYIVAASPTGAWAGHAGKIARYYSAQSSGPGWEFYTPKKGWRAYVDDEDVDYEYTGAAWENRESSAGTNLLVNGDFALNQRGFAGGARSAGVYGHDRWGAYNGGANWSVSAGVVTLTSGVMCQVIESPGLAGRQVAVSVEDPSGTIAVTIGNGTGGDSATGNITVGAGRRSVTLTVPGSITGDLKIRLAATAVSFKRVKVELGLSASPWVQPDRALEIQRASRYCYLLAGVNSFAYVGQAASTTLAYVFVPAFMRTTPVAIGITGAVSASAANIAGSVTGTLRLAEGIIRLAITVASGLVAGNASGLAVSANAHLDAEIACTD